MTHMYKHAESKIVRAGWRARACLHTGTMTQQDVFMTQPEHHGTLAQKVILGILVLFMQHLEETEVKVRTIRTESSVDLLMRTQRSTSS